MQNSFAVSDDNVVVCPLPGQGGGSCGKKCTGVSGRNSRSAAISKSPRAAAARHRAARRPGRCQSMQVAAADAMTGQAVPLHNGAYPTSPPRALHFEASRHRGELPAHGEHTTARASSSSTTAAPGAYLSTASESVPAAPLKCVADTAYSVWRGHAPLLRRRPQLEYPTDIG